MDVRKVLGPVLMIAAVAFAVYASAQTPPNSFQQTNLVSDIAVTPPAAHPDMKLVNPWGIAYFPGKPFWISDNNSGFSTVYDQSGNQQLVVKIPPPAGSNAPATPTGIVTSTSGFVVTSSGGTAPSQFIFSTEDGTISGWNGVGDAVLGVDHSGLGAVYKGLAMTTDNSGNNFILATNFNSGKVDIFDQNFAPATLSGTFSDPTLPAGFVPFGIQRIGNQIFVTYALQNSLKHDPVSAPGNGFVNVFKNTGELVGRFASNGNLNSPWGMVVAPASFGPFGGDVLIGNFGDGWINIFDTSGNFKSTLKDQSGNILANSGLWGLIFGGGGQSGDPNTLYFTAGLAGETHGLFGAIVPAAQNLPPGADFNLGVSPMSMTVARGQTATFNVSITPANGFNGPVSFSCSGLPAGVACNFTPATVTPSAGAATTTMTISTSNYPVASVGRSSMGMLAFLAPLFGLGLVGMVHGRSRGKKPRKILMGGGLILMLALLLSAVACSGNGKGMSTTPNGTSSVMVTATSGALTHTVSVTLTVN